VSVDDHAEDAIGLLDHLGVRAAHVAGHSSGAAVAAQLALEHPERVASCVLLELSLLSVPAGQTFFTAAGPAFEAFANGEPEHAVGLFMAVASGMSWDRCRALLEERMPGSVAQTVKDADTFFGVELPALGAWTFGTDEARAIDQPALSITGTETQQLWIEVAEFLRSAVPHLEESTIEGVGHLLHIERPAPVADAIATFLARHPIAS
jgi:3-oxoadipate enol-lactonase